MSDQSFSVHSEPMKCAASGCPACIKQLGYNAGVRDERIRMVEVLKQFAARIERGEA